MEDQEISVKILFFAQAREQTKLTEGSALFPRKGYKAREILDNILLTFPELRGLEKCVILAKNQNYLDFNSDEVIDLKEDDEIAVIPPISSASMSIVNVCKEPGGVAFGPFTEDKCKLSSKRTMDFVKLVHDRISSDEILELVTSPKCGAISTFIGITRDNFEKKKVVQLEYEAYEPMAISEIKKICVQIRENWPVEHIAIYHRLGLVPVSEASVYVAISSEHRQESLDAVSFAINNLKATVPIWKKEVYGDNERIQDSAWKANSECFWSKNNKGPSSNLNDEQSQSVSATNDDNLVEIN